jgi:CHAD domain-containing protein
MLSKKEQKNYFRKCWKKIDRYLIDIVNKVNMEDVHKLRIEIKKLDALSILYRKCIPGSRISEHLHPVKKLFRHLGMIRSAQLNLKLAKNHNIQNEEFFRWQSNLILQLTSKLKAHRKLYQSRINHSFDNLLKSTSRIDSDCFDKAYFQVFQKTINYFKDPSDFTKIHKNRKRIKFLLYNLDHLSSPLKDEISQSLEVLDTLQGAIGQWHDYDGLIELLESTNSSLVDDITILRDQAELRKKEVLSIVNQLK